MPSVSVYRQCYMLARTELVGTLTYQRTGAEFCVAAEQDGSKLVQNAVIRGTEH